MWNVYHGVPFGPAFGMSPEELQRFLLDDTMRSAFSIVFSEFEGNKFDWDRMQFVKPDQ